jgi:hypothetical protein
MYGFLPDMAVELEACEILLSVADQVTPLARM